jgi:hypothetical protein
MNTPITDLCKEITPELEVKIMHSREAYYMRPRIVSLDFTQRTSAPNQKYQCK